MKNKTNILILSIAVIILLMITVFNCNRPTEEDKDEKLQLWKDQEKITAFDGTDSLEFGYSAAVSGDYVIIGTSRDAAYIYHKTDVNTWDTGIKITAFDDTDTSWFNFGSSVSISGDYAIAGAPNNNNGGIERGAAYIFHRTGINTWDTGYKITASDIEDNDMFGTSVSIHEDYAIVGAPFNGENGAAYIFKRIDINTWDSGFKITSLSDGDGDDRFGQSVAIYNDYVITGAPNNGDDSNGEEYGSAYIFRRTGLDNNWSEIYKISALYQESYDHLGNSVSISVDYAIAGVTDANTFGNNCGSAYIFHRTDLNTWDEGSIIYALDGEAGDKFGYSVSICGDYAIAGVPFNDSQGDRSGTSYIFHRTGINEWDAGTKIKGFDTDELDFFGYSVAISQTHAIIGASVRDEVASGKGAVYILKK
ncbi:MAG: FG-GAP repeat protein [Spirochaetes bacterium]|nr:FG-GAP repeat protein [Spirochaetota bacterium]